MRYGSHRRTTTFLRVVKLQPNTNPIVGELRNWYQAGKMYGGEVYGSKMFPDGKHIFTAVVKEMKDHGDMWIIKTYAGTWWIAYKDKHHPQKQDVKL